MGLVVELVVHLEIIQEILMLDYMEGEAQVLE
jgi:hypothetical protein